MNLWLYARKNVDIILKNGQAVSGFVQDYCDGLDSDEGVDSLSVDVGGTLYEYFETEICSISLT